MPDTRAKEPSNALRIAHLKAAREHLEHVLDSLDLSDSTCECCGSRRYTNFDDQQLGKKLSGMVEKIEGEQSKLAGLIERSGRGDFHRGDRR